MSHIAFLGAGLIGGGMVRGALARGEQAIVWNRSLDKARALAGAGARVAPGPREAVEGAARVHLALNDDAAVDAVLDQAAPGIGRDVLVIDHTTTSAAGTAERAAACERRGIAFLHAPVFMSPAMCEKAKGLMLCAGPRDRFERAEPALAAMTGEVWWVGERPDLAAAHKLFGNAMIAAIVGGLADVFTMASALGIPPEDAHALFSRFKPGLTVDLRGAKMARGDFSPTFMLSMARKDVRLMLEAAGDRPLAVLPGLAARMDQVIAAGRGADDFGALAADAVEATAPKTSTGDPPSPSRPAT
jgi:3-hydroxyisobutyrate dehydrogenase-like beta-hydroxyacid dehydrogenase